ncbi:MAG: hypothetical protein KY468_17700, partial [Armatimonadetes bacterium]|nr:hypothetical protein [Armatimonadota bacterium]
MSIDLGVRLVEPIVIEQLRTETERALKEILNLPKTPLIHINEFYLKIDNDFASKVGKEECPISFDTFDPQEYQTFEDYIFSFKVADGKDDYYVVELSFSEVSKISHPKSREDWEIWGQMSLSMSRYPIQEALMAAIAIALARLGHTTIEDCAWMTPYGEPTVDQLLSDIVNPIQ